MTTREPVLSDEQCTEMASKSGGIPMPLDPEDRALIRAAFAAGRASVPSGEPVAWQLLNACGQPEDWIRLNPPIDDTEQWRPLYAATGGQDE